MAGSWIKWDRGLSRKPEVIAIAAALKLDRRLVAACCMEVWEWSDDVTEDGRIEGVGGQFALSLNRSSPDSGRTSPNDSGRARSRRRPSSLAQSNATRIPRS